MQPHISFTVIESEKKGKVKKLKKQLCKEKVARRDAEQRVCDLEFAMRNAEQATENANNRVKGLEGQLETERAVTDDLQASQPTVYATREHESLVQYADDVFVARVSYPGDRVVASPVMWETADAAQSWLDSMHKLYGPKEAQGDAQPETQYPGTEKAETSQDSAPLDPESAVEWGPGSQWKQNDAHERYRINRDLYQAGEWVQNNGDKRPSFVLRKHMVDIVDNDDSSPAHAVYAEDVNWVNVKEFKRH